MTAPGLLVPAAGEPGPKVESAAWPEASTVEVPCQTPKRTSSGSELPGLFLLWGASSQHLAGCDLFPVRTVSPGQSLVAVLGMDLLKVLIR